MYETGYIGINGTQSVIEGARMGVEWYSDAMLKALKQNPLVVFRAVQYFCCLIIPVVYVH